jgi:hypothetical protein
MQGDWPSIALCILAFLFPLFYVLRPYMRRYQSTPFLTPVWDGQRMVPFGVMQVKRLAEQKQCENGEGK